MRPSFVDYDASAAVAQIHDHVLEVETVVAKEVGTSGPAGARSWAG